LIPILKRCRKYFRGKWDHSQVALHRLVVPFNPLPQQLLPFKYWSTILRPLVRYKAKIMAISSSSERSHSSCELES
jgi:hypothetical protein